MSRGEKFNDETLLMHFAQNTREKKGTPSGGAKKTC